MFKRANRKSRERPEGPGVLGPPPPLSLRRRSARLGETRAGHPDGKRAGPAAEMIDAFIELAEARAAWEEEYARTLSLLVQHDVLAAAVGGRRLPRPYPGLRLLAQRGPIAAVLSEPELPERLKEAIPREAQRYREEWLARLDLARRRWQSLEVPTRRAS